MPVDHNPVNSLVSMQANAAFMSNGNAKNAVATKAFMVLLTLIFHLVHVKA